MYLSSRRIFSQKVFKINDFIINVESSLEMARSAKYTAVNTNEDRLFNKSSCLTPKTIIFIFFNNFHKLF
ncbi:hypothetical protein SAMN05444146_3109 [Flavobacterium johnsoniae]|nr:hypothetical protein SAMN05444146_3109 [Flavobacterium johnsoniae]